MRYLAATELLYVMYIGSVARNRMSKKLERLLSVMLLLIMPSRIITFKVNDVGHCIISFTLYPAYISSVVIVGFLFNKSSLNLYFLVVQGLVLYLSLG